MTDYQTVVDSYADLASDRFLEGREPDLLADALNDIAETDMEVAVLEEWLIEETDLRPRNGTNRLFVGEVERETDKAVLFDAGGRDDWIPKSCSQLYTTNPGVEIETPQSRPTDHLKQPEEVDA